MPQTVEVEIVRAYWTAEDERRNTGEKITVDVDTAMTLIEKGIVKTVPKAPTKPAKSA